MNVKLISLFTISSLYYNDSILHLNGVLKLDELLLACENTSTKSEEKRMFSQAKLLSAPENPLRNSVWRNVNPDALVWSGG